MAEQLNRYLELTLAIDYFMLLFSLLLMLFFCCVVVVVAVLVYCCVAVVVFVVLLLIPHEPNTIIHDPDTNIKRGLYSQPSTASPWSRKYARSLPADT